MIDLALLKSKFFTDPDWKMVEELLRSYIDPMVDFNTIDIKAPAEHVKAEVIGRMYAYNGISKFLSESQFINRPLKDIKNPFL
jgi:hypothetical protein